MWVKVGDLTSYKFANESRITESELKNFLERKRMVKH
jgi:hypothetical protein